MTTTTRPDGTLVIDAYSLPDLLLELQEHIQDGYVLDYEKNENFPFGLVNQFQVGLVPGKGKSKPVETQKQAEPTKEEEKKEEEDTTKDKGTRPGRKPASK